MKIAVFHNLPKGGALRVVKEQIKRLKKENKVDIFTVPDQFSKSRWRKDFFKFFSLKRIHQKLAETIDKRKYDIVLVHPSKYTQAPYLLKYLKTPTVYYLHEPLRIAYEYHLFFRQKVGIVKKTYENLMRFYLKKIDQENTRSATKILVNSYHTLEAVIKNYGIYPQVCYPGVDINFFKPIKIKKKKEILFVGQPSKMTGFHLLKQAVRLIEQKARIKVIKGNLSDQELLQAYNQATLTVCLSEVEPFGLVPLESMACATPVVALKEGGYRESVVDGKTGFLVDRNIRFLAEKIDLLLANSKLASKMGQTARQYVKKHWTWKKSIKNLKIFLNETISFHHHR